MVKMVVTMWQLHGQIVKVEIQTVTTSYMAVYMLIDQSGWKSKAKSLNRQTVFKGEIFIAQEDSYDSYNNYSLHKSDIAAKKNDWQL